MLESRLLLGGVKLGIAVPDKPRPMDFSAKAGSEQILVTFERVPEK